MFQLRVVLDFVAELLGLLVCGESAGELDEGGGVGASADSEGVSGDHLDDVFLPLLH